MAIAAVSARPTTEVSNPFTEIKAKIERPKSAPSEGSSQGSEQEEAAFVTISSESKELSTKYADSSGVSPALTAVLEEEIEEHVPVPSGGASSPKDSSAVLSTGEKKVSSSSQEYTSYDDKGHGSTDGNDAKKDPQQNNNSNNNNLNTYA